MNMQRMIRNVRLLAVLGACVLAGCRLLTIG